MDDARGRRGGKLRVARNEIEQKAADKMLRQVSYADLLRRIASVRSINCAELSDATARNRLGRIMHGYKTTRHLLKWNMMFRARKNDIEPVFHSAHKLWYPPAEKVQRGRFNRAGEPLFYVAGQFGAAVSEIRPKLDDVITVMVVTSRHRYRGIACAHIGLQRCKAPEIAFGARHALLGNSPALQDALGDPRFAKRWLAIDNYLGDVAVADCEENPDFYKLTNALYYYLSTYPETDGLSYPSVAAGMNALNLCFPPEKADEIFKPFEAWMLRITPRVGDAPCIPCHSGELLGVNFIGRAKDIGDDGELKWQPPGDTTRVNFLFNPPNFPIH
jgi:hypothetical protein